MRADSVKSYNNNQIEEFIAFLRDNKENIPSIQIALVDGSVLALSIFETPEFEKELRKIKLHFLGFKKMIGSIDLRGSKNKHSN